jgi:hypothetical protein
VSKLASKATHINPSEEGKAEKRGALFSTDGQKNESLSFSGRPTYIHGLKVTASDEKALRDRAENQVADFQNVENY